MLGALSQKYLENYFFVLASIVFFIGKTKNWWGRLWLDFYFFYFLSNLDEKQSTMH